MKIVELPQVPSTPIDMEGVKGATKQVPIGVADGAPSFSMRVFTLEAGGHTPYHHHPWEHENYILAGSGVLRTEDGSERPIKAGDFVLILPGEKHQFRNTSEKAELQFICLVPKERE